MPIDELHPAPAPILDRACVGCGYNLRGLAISGRCPECGLPVTPAGNIDDPLSLMPRPVIKRFVIGSWMATGAAIGVIAMVIFAPWMSFDTPIGAARFVMLALLWLIAAWLVTPALSIPQAVWHGFSQTSRLRKAARVLQFGWLLAAGARLASALVAAQPAPAAGTVSPGNENLQEMLGVLAIAGAAIGVAGIVVIGIVLGRLATWARDDDAQRAFNLAVWGIPITTVFMFADVPILLLGLLLILVWALVVGVFPYALWSLSRSLTWAVRHSHEHQERLRRGQRRREKYDAEIVGNVRRMDTLKNLRSEREKKISHGK